MDERITRHSKIKDQPEIVQWNNKLRHTRPVDMPFEVQVFLEGYIAEFIPRESPVCVWFDVYDLEEKRL